MSYKGRIGVGVITCERLPYLRGLLKSLEPCCDTIDELVVVNDGKPINNFKLEYGTWIQNDTNQGVAKSKNKAMRHLFDKRCDYIFIIEDDMIIKDKSIFQQYVNAYKARVFIILTMDLVLLLTASKLFKIRICIIVTCWMKARTQILN